MQHQELERGNGERKDVMALLCASGHTNSRPGWLAKQSSAEEPQPGIGAHRPTEPSAVCLR